MKALSLGQISVAVILVASSWGLSSTPVAGEDSPEELVAAIDMFRGLDLEALSDAEREELAERLDALWETSRERPNEAQSLIREALDKETSDSFFILLLSHLYLGLEEDLSALEEVSKWTVRADPRAEPGTYFAIASAMASSGCKSCPPTVLRMLELEELKTSIPAHALPVNLEMGLLFSVVPYGDSITPEVVSRLTSPDCVVRSNAAAALALLLPPETPATIEEMAASDSCEGARAGALRALAMADPPAFWRAFDVRSAADPGHSELLAMVEALSLAPPNQSISRLKALSESSDPEVAEAAGTTLEKFQEGGGFQDAPPLFSSRSGKTRKKLLRELTKATKTSRFEYRASPNEMVAALKPEDYALLNNARRSVLRRLSDEALYEFGTLHAATLTFREALRAARQVEN